jgi:hypothetical protein
MTEHHNYLKVNCYLRLNSHNWISKRTVQVTQILDPTHSNNGEGDTSTYTNNSTQSSNDRLSYDPNHLLSKSLNFGIICRVYHMIISTDTHIRETWSKSLNFGIIMINQGCLYSIVTDHLYQVIRWKKITEIMITNFDYNQ